MTVDTSPEAIAALLDGVTPGPLDLETVPTSCGVCHKIGEWPSRWVLKISDACIYEDYPPTISYKPTHAQANARFIAAARELVPALEATITRLTAERDALEEDLRDMHMQAVADGAQFQMDVEDLTAERDAAWNAAIRAAAECCEVGPSDEWSEETRYGYLFGAGDCARNISKLLKPEEKA